MTAVYNSRIGELAAAMPGDDVRLPGAHRAARTDRAARDGGEMALPAKFRALAAM